MVSAHSIKGGKMKCRICGKKVDRVSYVNIHKRCEWTEEEKKLSDEITAKELRIKRETRNFYITLSIIGVVMGVVLYFIL